MGWGEPSGPRAQHTEASTTELSVWRSPHPDVDRMPPSAPTRGRPVASGLELQRPLNEGISTDGNLRLLLLAGFRLFGARQGQQLLRGHRAQCLVACIALHGGNMTRDLLAGLLWPNVSEGSAHAALRSALARVARAAPALVRSGWSNVSLNERVSVDLHHATRLAKSLVQPGSVVDLDAAYAWLPALSSDLLPGWYDDWVVEAAERWRQLRLHALESLGDALREQGRYGQAVIVAGAAVAADPLRETARAALMRVHLAEGNRSEAKREFERYRRLTRRDLRMEPSERLQRLL